MAKEIITEEDVLGPLDTPAAPTAGGNTEPVADSNVEALTTGSISSVKNILARIVAVFAASGLGVIGAGAVVGISTVKAIILAGTLGVASVVEKLARGFLDDGKLDINEINDAFNSVDKKSN